VISTGILNPDLSFVFSLNALQNSMILIPLCPSAGPTGGDGFAAPAGICNFNIPVEITVYKDKSFTFVVKQPPMSDLIKKEANLKKGSDNALKNKVATLTKEQIMKIVELKISDLNTNDVEQAAKIVEGSCRSMGIEVS
jgi:ribosomal protein L11